MLIAMLMQERWLFALMTGAGMVGCLAVPLASWLRRRQSEREAADSGVADSPAVAPRDAASHTAAVQWHTFAAMSLESLLHLDGYTAAVPWQPIVRWWLMPPSLRVPLGIGTEGTVWLDLARQGPHALVAGTTGSGKSVLLQAWCLALAARNPPEALTFVFLDFKGGAAFRPLEQLPHTVGSVCDLDLKSATRALLALERELTRREHLVAAAGVQRWDELSPPPPRLMAVVDEFHALRGQLPDYVDRLTRIASLGRSLGMHVVACTQNPSGQVSPDMKTNMSLNLCLRVRDPMQSTELLGNAAAASISPETPGGLWCADGATLQPWRCAHINRMPALLRAITLATRFHTSVIPAPLFSPPLPADAGTVPHAARNTAGAFSVIFALGDDGIVTSPVALPLDQGNVGLIGHVGSGRTSLLRLLEQECLRLPDAAVYMADHASGRMRRITAASQPALPGPLEPPEPPQPLRTAQSDQTAQHAHSLWLVDDADPLFDPFATSPLAGQFRTALADPAITVVFAVTSTRHVRIPEHCPVRVVFPGGDRTADQLAGIPAALWNTLHRDDYDTPGRAVLIHAATALLVQCCRNRP